MKVCSKCGLEKERSEFNKCARNKDGLHTYCRECHKAHYRGNRERHCQNVKRVKKEYRKNILEIVFNALSGGCVDCGYQDIRVLEFDHVRGDKVAGVMTLVRNQSPASKVLAEIDKCEVRCKNCHAVKTYERIGKTWHDNFMPL